MAAVLLRCLVTAGSAVVAHHHLSGLHQQLATAAAEVAAALTLLAVPVRKALH